MDGMSGGPPGGMQMHGMGGGRRRHLEDITEGKVFIGGIDNDVTEHALASYCSGWGEVENAFVSTKGFGFVTFKHLPEAFRFLEHEPHHLNGRDVEVKAAVPKSRGGGQRATNKLFVGGVPRDVVSEDLKQHFSQYGHVDDAVIVMDQNNVSRGFGFVTYDNNKSVEKALIVKHEFRDKLVDVKRAVPKDEIRNQDRPGYAGGYGGGYGGYGAQGRGGQPSAYDNPYAQAMNTYGMGYGMGMGMGAYNMGYAMGAYGGYGQMGGYAPMGGYGQMGGGMGGGMGGMGGGGGGGQTGMGGYGRTGGGRSEGRANRYQPY